MSNAIGREDGQITIVAGKTRSGKSVFTKAETQQGKRAIAWDTKGEYGRLKGWDTVTSLAELVEYCLEREDKPGRVAYKPDASELVPGSAAFNTWARVALEWGKVAPVVAIAEELADVTAPGKAPSGWGQLVRKGLEYGINIYAVTQRPAESDKTVFGNASNIVCFMLVRANDKAYMAQEMGIAADDVPSMPLHYVMAELDKNKAKKGKLEF